VVVVTGRRVVVGRAVVVAVVLGAGGTVGGAASAGDLVVGGAWVTADAVGDGCIEDGVTGAGTLVDDVVATDEGLSSSAVVLGARWVSAPTAVSFWGAVAGGPATTTATTNRTPSTENPPIHRPVCDGLAARGRGAIA
jgi:hypothetical protein